MKSVVILMCLVAVISASSEVDFLRRRSSVVVGKPMQVPVFPNKRNINQQKRQVDFDAGNRPSSSSAGPSARQQPAGVPLQAAFRPPPPAEFRRPQAQRAQERPQQDRPVQERPQQEESDASTRGGAPSSFGPSSSQEQIFAPARDTAERPVERPVERPARQQPAQRPARPAAPSSFSGSSAERPQRQPEFAGGFPTGFTSGLPSFDFQGRMPEPDAKSDGFMESALNDFPNLKALGGFDAFPEVSREGDSAAKRPAQNRPARPSAQKIKRASGNLTEEISTSKNSSKKLLKNNKKEKLIVLEDDEAMLEPDFSPVNNTTSDNKKHHHQPPTDIADIIADSVGEEQRFSPSFHPNSGPYGGRITPTVAPINPPQSSSTSFRSRRPSSVGSFSNTKNNRQNQRTPYLADNFNEFVDGENSLLGSGNFDVLGGGVFRDTIDYQRPYINNPPQYFPSSSPTPPPIIQDVFRPQQPFFPSNHPSPPPVGDQFGAFIPPIKSSINNNGGSINNNNNNYANIPNFPSSFFNDDDFFSNFRDFADVNQDYRNP